MAIRDRYQRKLVGLGQRLDRWREEHGGPGRLIPDEFWVEAAAIARVVGSEAVARSLRIDRARLEVRVEGEPLIEGGAVERAQFVEVDASRLQLMGKTVVRLEARDGERLEVELNDATALDVLALASAFWRRPR